MDGTVAAQQAVLRLSHWPALRRGHVIDVLLGRAAGRVSQLGHDGFPLSASAPTGTKDNGAECSGSSSRLAICGRTAKRSAR